MRLIFDVWLVNQSNNSDFPCPHIFHYIPLVQVPLYLFSGLPGIPWVCAYGSVVGVYWNLCRAWDWDVVRVNIVESGRVWNSEEHQRALLWCRISLRWLQCTSACLWDSWPPGWLSCVGSWFCGACRLGFCATQNQRPFLYRIGVAVWSCSCWFLVWHIPWLGEAVVCRSVLPWNHTVG